MKWLAGAVSLLLIGAPALAQSTSASPTTAAGPSTSSSSSSRKSSASTPPVAPEPTVAERAGKLRSEGNEAMLAMRYSDALDHYQKALALQPEEVGLYYSIARAQQFIGDYPDALGSLETFEARANADVRSKVGKLDDLYALIRPRVSTLELTGAESGARVIVRDKVLGTTPLAPTRLPAGATTLQVELDGFFAETRDIVLPGGGILKVDVPLHRRSNSSLLAITSSPTGARIAVDGQELGTTSPRFELALPAGAHQIVASHDGYDDANLSLMLNAGATREVAVPLEKSRSVFTRWWFWTAVGAAVAGGVVLTYALTTEKAADHGTLAPGQVGGP